MSPVWCVAILPTWSIEPSDVGGGQYNEVGLYPWYASKNSWHKVKALDEDGVVGGGWRGADLHRKEQPRIPGEVGAVREKGIYLPCMDTNQRRVALGQGPPRSG